VDIEHPLTLINAVDRAFLDAGEVLQVHTWLRNDICHEFAPRFAGGSLQ